MRSRPGVHSSSHTLQDVNIAVCTGLQPSRFETSTSHSPLHSTLPAPNHPQQRRRLINIRLRWRILSQIISLSQNPASEPHIHRQQHADDKAQHAKHNVDGCWVVVENLVRCGDEQDLNDVAHAGDEDDGAVDAAESCETADVVGGMLVWCCCGQEHVRCVGEREGERERGVVKGEGETSVSVRGSSGHRIEENTYKTLAA